MQETLTALDHVRLNFSPESLHMLNIALAFIMFGVALEIKIDHFKKIFLQPKSAIIGAFSQFLLLPFLTFLLVLALSKFLSPTMALGMILVAACPGGNISNFISSIAIKKNKDDIETIKHYGSRNAIGKWNYFENSQTTVLSKTTR